MHSAMALWAAAELELDVPEDVARDLNSLLAENEETGGIFRAQDIGMLLTGIVAQAKAGRKDWLSICRPAIFLPQRSIP